MLSVMENICATGGKRNRTATTRIPGVAAVTGLAAAALISGRSVLSLPRLTGVIPLAVVPRRLAAANATIARFLIQAGALREGDVPEVWDDAIEVCQRALDAWVKRELGPLHCLSPAFSLTASDGSDCYSMPRTNEPVCYRSVEVCWFESNEQQWIVGAGLEALERERSGLGQAVLDILRRQSRFVYPVFTPDLACDVASYIYWCGDENEEVALDMECGDDPEARAAMRDDMVTRQKLDEAFPLWATSTPHKRLSVAAFERLTSGLDDPVMRDIAADALTLSRLRIKDEFRPDVDGEYLGWGAVLSWREDDLTVRIYDDLLHMAHQGEFCDRMGVLEIALDAPQAMRAWQRAMRLRFKAIRLIDRLIHRLSEGH